MLIDSKARFAMASHPNAVVTRQRRFKGKPAILLNCAALAVGFDLPCLSAVLFADPKASEQVLNMPSLSVSEVANAREFANLKISEHHLSQS